jgi:uncharacterized protein YndB with AHSA1/START domain
MTAATRQRELSDSQAGIEFTISRTVDAPRELVWKAFTEPERLKHWWGPKGFTVRSCTVDLKPGGVFHYCLVAPNGQELWGRFVYREIAAPERLHFVVSFSDEHGGVTRNPWDENWPLQTLSTITFAEEDGKTAVTVNWVPHDATEKEKATFAAGHDSMRQGWGGTLDQLGEYLAKARQESPGKSEAGCMAAQPQPEHQWLEKLLGEWTYEHEASMQPGQPAIKLKGSETVRSLGGLWTVGEGQGEMPGGSTARSVMTLGYDPQRSRFVGTFVASMMTHLWLYEGSLDPAGKVLTLDTEGPNFGPGGGMRKYQDVISFRSDDHRTLTSRMLGDDGQWHEFMIANYRRKK